MGRLSRSQWAQCLTDCLWRVFDLARLWYARDKNWDDAPREIGLPVSRDSLARLRQFSPAVNEMPALWGLRGIHDAAMGGEETDPVDYVVHDWVVARAAAVQLLNVMRDYSDAHPMDDFADEMIGETIAAITEGDAWRTSLENDGRILKRIRKSPFYAILYE